MTGLLGPNGAGKTIAVRILSTPLEMDSGARRRSRGTTSAGKAQEVRRRIGLVGQYAAVDEVLTGRQNLVMFGRLNHLGHAGRGTTGGRTARAVQPDRGGRPVGDTPAGCAGGSIWPRA